MTFSLQGKKALVTGSSRGIGRSIALALAGAGADVIVHGIRRAEAAEETLRQIAETGARGLWVEGDFAAEGGAPTGQRVLELCQGVNILVLNASIQISQPWEQVTAAEIERQMTANFRASLELVQVLVPPMRQKKWGRILTIGSVQEVKPHPQMLVYAASKAAQTSMVLSLAKQLAPDGITVNNLAPGVIQTDRNSVALSDPAYSEKVRANIPLGFFGEAADCAGAALLMCSDAGRYITGQSLNVDGGLGLP